MLEASFVGVPKAVLKFVTPGDQKITLFWALLTPGKQVALKRAPNRTQVTKLP
jgi:hypothetical protein